MSYTKDSSISFPLRGARKTPVVAYDPTSGSYTYSTEVRTINRTLTGNRLANWRSKIEKGENATTSMTAVYETLKYDSISYAEPIFVRERANDGTYWTYVVAGDWWVRNSDHSIPVTRPGQSSSFVDNLARGAFFARLNQETTRFQGGVFLGEIGETLHMLRRPAFGLQKLTKDFIDALKKRKRSSPKSWMKNIGEMWLEQSFGWNPLIADSRDAISAYQIITDASRKPTVRISVGRKKEYPGLNTLGVESPGYTWVNGTGLAFRNVSLQTKEIITVRYRAALKPQVKAPTWGTNMELFGFSPQNFIPTVWELIPWSFLVDYFTNVGELLTAQCTSTTNIAYVNKTVIRESHKLLTRTAYDNGGVSGLAWKRDGSYLGNLGRVATTRKEVTRTADSGVSPPSFQMNFDLTDGQLLNVAALLSQVNTDLHPQRTPRRWHR